VSAGHPLVATCLWLATPELVVRLDDTFGEPLDTYVNGSQVWLRDDGPGETTIEWRLHPVASYERPKGVPTEDVFAATALAFARSSDPPAPLDRLWDGLEAFAAYGDEIEPAVLAGAATAAIGLPPDATGLADHQRIAEAWDRSNRTISITGQLLAELRPPPAPA